MSKNIPVFDIGDTLIPSSENINQAVNSQLHEVGVEDPPFFPINEFNIYRTEDVQAWLDKHGVEANPEKITEAYLDWKDRYFDKSDVLKVLKEINRDYGPIGFISDNSLEAEKYYRDVFERHGVQYNGFTVSERVGVKKPDRKIFETFVQERDEEPDRFTYYGNYVDRDIGAKKVGMNFVWVTQHHTFDSKPYNGPEIERLSYRNIEKTL